jgi:hypothetical protein
MSSSTLSEGAWFATRDLCQCGNVSIVPGCASVDVTFAVTAFTASRSGGFLLSVTLWVGFAI